MTDTTNMIDMMMIMDTDEDKYLLNSYLKKSIKNLILFFFACIVSPNSVRFYLAAFFGINFVERKSITKH